MKRVRIDQAARVVLIEYSGAVEHADAQIGNPALRREDWSSYVFIVDLTRVTTFNVSTEDIQIAAARSGPDQPRVRCAFIAPSDVAFGLTRMFELLSAGGQFMVFRTAVAACEWLGVTAATYETLRLGPQATKEESKG
jgi:hypothetical protein